MKKFGIYAVCFLTGLSVGYLAFGNEGTNIPETQMQTMSNMSSTSAMHMHSMVEIDPVLPTPSISVEALKDEKDGYNLHVITENYVFTPENVNREPTQGEGHAHIYVNGIKVARLYGHWFNLSSSKLQDGENMIEVTLNANDHSEWVQNGIHISNAVTVMK